MGNRIPPFGGKIPQGVRAALVGQQPAPAIRGPLWVQFTAMPHGITTLVPLERVAQLRDLELGAELVVTTGREGLEILRSKEQLEGLQFRTVP